MAFSLLGSIFTAAHAVLPSKWQADADHLRLDEAVKHLFGNKSYTVTEAVLIQMPELAEDGGNVPITISSTLADVRSISIFSDKNPSPLIAVFKFTATVDAFVKTRIKMAESGKVIVFVEAGEDKPSLYRAEKALKVVVGGCDVQAVHSVSNL